MRPVIASAAKQSIEPHAARGITSSQALLGRSNKLMLIFDGLRRGATGFLFTSPMGRGRRAAPGEGIRFIDTQKPLTRITSDDAIRPLPAEEVTNRPFHPAGSAKGQYQLAMTASSVTAPAA